MGVTGNVKVVVGGGERRYAGGDIDLELVGV
jgi:hypothetical protein